MTPHGAPVAGVAERLCSFQRSSQNLCEVDKGTLNGDERRWGGAWAGGGGGG